MTVGICGYSEVGVSPVRHLDLAARRNGAVYARGGSNSERVDGEAPLAPGSIVRFGTVQTIFEPTDDSVEAQQGGGTKVLESVDDTSPGDSGESNSSGRGSAP